MTKAEEMQRFDSFIQSLPQDSYLRPWLSGIRDWVETDLRNDIIPEYTPRETWEQCQNSRKEAAAAIRKDLDIKRAEARRILGDAESKAKIIIARAEADADGIRKSIRTDINRLRSALSAVA